MAYTKNTKFYKVINSIYKLTFIPADVTALSSPAEVEFPNDIILSSESTLVISKNYEDDLPLHLEETPEIQVALNLSNMTGDWADVKNWILNTADITDSTIYNQITLSYGNEYFFFPNQWILEKDTTGDGTFDTEIFTGMQLVNPSYTIEVNDNGESIAQIIVLDRIRAISQAYTREMILQSVKTLEPTARQATSLSDYYNRENNYLGGE